MQRSEHVWERHLGQSCFKAEAQWKTCSVHQQKTFGASWNEKCDGGDRGLASSFNPASKNWTLLLAQKFRNGSPSLPDAYSLLARGDWTQTRLSRSVSEMTIWYGFCSILWIKKWGCEICKLLDSIFIYFLHITTFVDFLGCSFLRCFCLWR